MFLLLALLKSSVFIQLSGKYMKYQKVNFKHIEFIIFYTLLNLE